MAGTVLVIGGARSGKSAEALRLADTCGAAEKIYLATSVPLDAEMAERVRKHQGERGADWRTVEEPLYVASAVRELSRPGTVVLLDCVTLWLTNLVMEGKTPEEIHSAAGDLAGALQEARGDVFVVTNETGCGIVPENAMARAFRDAAGAVNQTLARAATRVVWCVAGIPVVIKG
jgi:adenosylcobinamide kinase/adenosylcobinamide-phosphate guanylyltransferase